MLNVRGICCLRPGLQKVSRNITVVSIIDRFLEHARIFYFRNGGNQELYLASADWMGRNLDKRIETMFPVTDPALQNRLVFALNTYFEDNTNAYELESDGSWKRIQTRKSTPRRAQQILYDDAVNAVDNIRTRTKRFRPLKQPKK